MYKIISSSITQKYPNWVLFQKITSNWGLSYLEIPGKEDSKVDVMLTSYSSYFKWQMPKVLTIDKNIGYHFTEAQIQLGIFRFPIINDKIVQFEIGTKELELVNAKVLTFDSNQIESICFELLTIEESELRVVEKLWAQGWNKEEITKVRQKISANYQTLLNQAEQKIQENLDYQTLLIEAISGQKSLQEVQQQSKGILTTELL